MGLHKAAGKADMQSKPKRYRRAQAAGNGSSALGGVRKSAELK